MFDDDADACDYLIIVPLKECRVSDDADSRDYTIIM